MLFSLIRENVHVPEAGINGAGLANSWISFPRDVPFTGVEPWEFIWAFVHLSRWNYLPLIHPLPPLPDLNMKLCLSSERWRSQKEANPLWPAEDNTPGSYEGRRWGRVGKILCSGFPPYGEQRWRGSGKDHRKFAEESSKIMGLRLLHKKTCGSLEVWGQMAAKCIHVCDAASHWGGTMWPASYF